MWMLSLPKPSLSRKVKIYLIRYVNRWIYPHAVKVHISGYDRYSEIYDWLRANVGDMDTSVWGNLQQRTYTINTSRLRYSEMDGELRFKDAGTAMLFKLTFHDEISG